MQDVIRMSCPVIRKHKICSDILYLLLSGPNWKIVDECMDKGGNSRICLQVHALRQCRQARHKVIKVLRMSTDNLEYLLESRPNLKVIQLFRDPRAIINSRIETPWYASKSNITTRLNIQSVCSKMRTDVIESKKLLEKYPERFRLVYFEDLADSPGSKIIAIYKFLGMSIDPATYMEAFQTSPKKKEPLKSSNNTIYWWRQTLRWDYVKYIDILCGTLYNMLGYRSFKEVETLRRLSVPSVKIPNQFQIRNL